MKPEKWYPFESVKDHSYVNEAFIEGLRTFLDYTDPAQIPPKNGLMVRRHFQKEQFEARCIKRWAVSELVDYISVNPCIPVEESTYEFALMLLQFKENAAEASVKKIFAIAEDFIEKEVLDIFKAEEGVYP